MSRLELSILSRIYPVSAVITGCAFLCAAGTWGLNLALGILVGGLFGIFNTWLIALLARAILDPVKRSPVLAAATLFIKLPIVYGMLVLAFWRHWLDPVGFAIGFTLFLATMSILAIIAGAGEFVTKREDTP